MITLDPISRLLGGFHHILIVNSSSGKIDDMQFSCIKYSFPIIKTLVSVCQLKLRSVSTNVCENQTLFRGGN